VAELTRGKTGRSTKPYGPDAHEGCCSRTTATCRRRSNQVRLLTPSPFPVFTEMLKGDGAQKTMRRAAEDGFITATDLS
jgi:hypothetical protein